MTFACLGYIGESIGDAMSKSEQNAGVAECFAYDDILREKEHWPVFDSVDHARFARLKRHSTLAGKLVQAE